MDDPGIARIEKALHEDRPSSASLLEIWAMREPILAAAKEADPERGTAARPIPWLHDAELATSFTRSALAAGEYVLAADACREALRLHRNSVRLRHSLARALARLGSLPEALRILDELAAHRHLDRTATRDNLFLIGSLHLEKAEDSADPIVQAALAELALDAFRKAATEKRSDPLALIEAAIAGLLTGPAGLAAARGDAERALSLLDQWDPEDDADVQATAVGRACALAICRDQDAARAGFRELQQARAWPPHVLGAARRRGRMVAKALGHGANAFDACFPPLHLVVFSGHMLDAARRRVPRLPSVQAHVDRVRVAIRSCLDEIDARVGFSGAAAGADLLFLEEMRAREASVHVVLPWRRDEFVAASVAPFGQTWTDAFDRLVGQATSVRVLSQMHLPTDVAGFEHANAVLSGLARVRARELDLDVLPLVYWDGEPGLPGGTGTFVDLWRSRLVEVREVRFVPAETAAAATTSLAAGPAATTGPAAETAATDASRAASTASDLAAAASPLPPPQPSTVDGMRHEVRAMLFADIVGYSRLRESAIPRFVSEFLGRVSRLIAQSEHSPLSVNTWGDAIYLVFDGVTAAGVFALELTEMIAETPWEKYDLTWDDAASGGRRPLSIRIGLHAGPVFVHFDPVVRGLGFTGAEVSRAARIEPVTEPGHVFASEEFAALAALDRVQLFACDLVGTMPLAKKYPGEFRLYRLRRVREMPLEQLARLVHEDYCAKALARGETPQSNPSLRAWEELPEELRESNRRQVADIRRKLRELLGCDFELSPSQGDATFVMSPDEEDLLARAEHERWYKEKIDQGWTLGAPRDDAKRVHDCLIPWEALPAVQQQKDRDAVRNIPRLLALAGIRVRRIGKPL